MSRCYNYAIAQFATSQVRNERLNLGLVVIDDSRLDVHLPKSLDKVRAISAALDVDEVRGALEQLPDIYGYVLDQGIDDLSGRLQELGHFAAVSFSSMGQFTANTADQYDRYIERLLIALVEPEAAPAKEHRRRPTKLLSNVKSAFKTERVLARKGEGLDTHRIVTNYKVAEGLPADLALRNGVMHIVQTVDASSEDAPVKRAVSEIAVSALVFEHARMDFGDDGTRSNLVYKANSASESLITPSLDAAEHQGAKLINWESRDDRTRFIVELSSLAEPLADIRQKPVSGGIHASVQPKFRLN